MFSSLCQPKHPGMLQEAPQAVVSLVPPAGLDPEHLRNPLLPQLHGLIKASERFLDSGAVLIRYLGTSGPV